MKNTTRIIAFISALTLCSLCLTGCGNSKDSSDSAANSEISSEQGSNEAADDIDVDDYIANVLDDGIEEGESVEPVTNEVIDEEEMSRSNSKLVQYTKISPNKSVPRNHKIDTITIHCMCGQLSVETCGNVFASSKAQASSNYGVGKDGRIAMYVEEKDRSWCSSNSANDNRAVTIEVASDSYSPYAVSDKAYEATIRLVADICQRNGIKKLVWSTDKATRVAHKNGVNMTVHRDFANKACPGDYLYSRMGDIAKKVNAILDGKSKSQTTTSGKSNTKKDTSSKSAFPYMVKITSSTLDVRKEPKASSPVATTVKKGEVYSVTEEKKDGNITYGKLKSGVGWIDLSKTEKVN